MNLLSIFIAGAIAVTTGAGVVYRKVIVPEKDRQISAYSDSLNTMRAESLNLKKKCSFLSSKVASIDTTKIFNHGFQHAIKTQAAVYTFQDTIIDARAGHGQFVYTVIYRESVIKSNKKKVNGGGPTVTDESSVRSSKGDQVLPK